MFSKKIFEVASKFCNKNYSSKFWSNLKNKFYKQQEMQESTANTTIQKYSSSSQKYYLEPQTNKDIQAIAQNQNECQKVLIPENDSEKSIQQLNKGKKNNQKTLSQQNLQKQLKMQGQIQTKTKKNQNVGQCQMLLNPFKYKSNAKEQNNDKNNQPVQIKKDLNLLDLPSQLFTNQQIYYPDEKESFKNSQNSIQSSSEKESSETSIHQDSQDNEEKSVNLICVDEEILNEDLYQYSMRLLLAIQDSQTFQYCINQGNVPMKIKKILKNYNDSKKIFQIFQKTDYRKIQKRKKENYRKSFRPVLMPQTLKNKANICIQLKGRRNPDKGTTEYILEEIKKDQILFYPVPKIEQKEITLQSVKPMSQDENQEQFLSKLRSLNMIDDQLILTKLNYNMQNILQNTEKINIKDFFVKEPQKCFEFVSNEYMQLLKLYCYQHKKLRSIYDSVKDYNQFVYEQYIIQIIITFCQFQSAFNYFLNIVSISCFLTTESTCYIVKFFNLFFQNLSIVFIKKVCEFLSFIKFCLSFCFYIPITKIIFQYNQLFFTIFVFQCGKFIFLMACLSFHQRTFYCFLFKVLSRSYYQKMSLESLSFRQKYLFFNYYTNIQFNMNTNNDLQQFQDFNKKIQDNISSILDSDLNQVQKRINQDIYQDIQKRRQNLSTDNVKIDELKFDVQMISSKYVINAKIIQNIINKIQKNNAKKYIFYTLLKNKNEKKNDEKSKKMALFLIKRRIYQSYFYVLYRNYLDSTIKAQSFLETNCYEKKIQDNNSFHQNLIDKLQNILQEKEKELSMKVNRLQNLKAKFQHFCGNSQTQQNKTIDTRKRQQQRY